MCKNITIITPNMFKTFYSIGDAFAGIVHTRTNGEHCKKILFRNIVFARSANFINNVLITFFYFKGKNNILSIWIYINNNIGNFGVQKTTILVKLFDKMFVTFKTIRMVIT